MDLTVELTTEPSRKPFNGPVQTETWCSDGVPVVVVWYATHQYDGKWWAIVTDIELPKRFKRFPRAVLHELLRHAINALGTEYTVLYPCARKLLRRVEPLYMRSLIQGYKLGMQHLKFSPNGSKHPFMILREANDSQSSV